ncbi:uncharacterized protein isoform X4 [Leptinotarsa decemlineata]|uniref:uncharacterized protein isoform X4 n=1 Tax=Leptinotarsa decemlineata TaxID=7539 RepID=UPI003D30D583
MNHRLAFVIAIFFFCGVDCVDIKKVESIISQRVENDTEAASTEFPTGKGRSSRMIYAELVSCAVRYDTSCLVDVAEDYLEVQRQELLAQADAQVSASGRANPDNSPSHLAKTIEKLLSELAGMFKSGISSFFREAADDDEIDDADNNSIDNENKDDEKNSRDVVGKTVKLKNRVMNMMKLYALAKIIKAKIDLGLKLYMAAIQTKIFLVLLSILALSKIKLILDLKNRPEPSKKIYYEHSQHDHHYDGDIWGHDGDEGGFWGR